LKWSACKFAPGDFRKIKWRENSRLPWGTPILNTIGYNEVQGGPPKHEGFFTAHALTAWLPFANVSLELSVRFPSDIRRGVLSPDANRL
jgi:hypothetical protein